MSDLIFLDAQLHPTRLKREESLNTFVKSQLDQADFEVPGLLATASKLNSRNNTDSVDILSDDVLEDRNELTRKWTLSFRTIITATLSSLLLFYILFTQLPTFIGINFAVDYLRETFLELQIQSELVSLWHSLVVSLALLNNTLSDVERLIVSNTTGAAISAIDENFWVLVRTRELLESLQVADADQYDGSTTNYSVGGVYQTFASSSGPNNINILQTSNGGIYSVYIGWEDGSMSGSFRDPDDSYVYLQVPEMVLDEVTSESVGFGSIMDRLNKYPVNSVTREPKWDQRLSSEMKFNTTDRPWYKIQSQHALKNISSAIKNVAKWSEVYSFGDSSGNGMTLTYPVAFCMNYSCFGGVLGADVTVSKLIGDLQNQVALLESNVLKITQGDHPIDTPVVMFMVSNQNVSNQTGLLVASSNGAVSHIGDLIYAVDSKNTEVRQAATLVNQIRPFGSSSWTGNTSLCFVSYNGYLIHSCDELAKPDAKCPEAASGSAADITACFKTIFCKSENSTNCKLILALELSTPLVLKNNRAPVVGNNLEDARQVLVIDIEIDALLGSLFETYESINFDFQQAVSETASRKTSLVITLVIVTICMFAVTTLFTFLLSNWVARPLKRLERKIAMVKTLNFESDDLTEEEIKAGRSLISIRDINKIEDTFLNVKTSLRAFAKFVPATVVHNIINDLNNARKLHVEKREVTIMFSDIREFTAISETLSERDLLFLLSRYLTVMTKVVEAYGGVVAEILGDGLVAFWNTPDLLQDHALCACACALAQQHCMRQLNQEFRHLLLSNNLSDLRIGIGIHTGRVLTGNIGSRDKMKFGCIGDTINVASRIEGLTKLYGVGLLCSGSTFSSLPPDSFVVREIDKVKPKGKSKEVHLYQLVALRDTYEVQSCGPEESTHSSKNLFEETKNMERKKRPSIVKSFFLKRKSNSDEEKSVAGGKSLFRILSRALGNESIRNNECYVHKSSNTFLNPVGRELSESAHMDIESYQRSLHSYQAGYFKIAETQIQTIAVSDPAAEFLALRISKALAQYGPRVPVQDVWDSTLDLDMKNF